MHKYLRAIGLSRITRDELDKMMLEIRRNPDYHYDALDTEGAEFVEIGRDLAPDMGIALRGRYDDDGHFITEYYYPYRNGTAISLTDPVEIVRESSREYFLGMCDDIRLGIDLIFFVQDMMTILSSEQRNKKMVDFGGVTLCGLSTEGKILFPVYSTARQTENIAKYSEKHKELINAAKEGDREAYEELALDEMDTYSMISERIEHEDLYSIVTSYFMPNGIESDKYSVMGNIIACKKVVNHYSAEVLYVMRIECNDIEFDLCINSKDLYGEPEVGRRFKGSVWIQGRVHPILMR